MNFAAVFPGQGSQSVGMLKELSEAHSAVSDTFSEAADVLSTDYWQLAQNGPAEKLADTRITQPLMFISDIAIWRALQQAGMPAPTVVAGHSLGEFAALVACGALPFADGLTLVKRRAEIMATAVPEGEGGMAALIGMDDEEVIKVCADTTGARVSEAANFNAPGQVAISGHIDALEKTIELAKERGARKAIMLAVSVPNHSSIMNDAGSQLVTLIDAINWSEPAIPIVQNAQASAPADLNALLKSLRSHVFSPVLWTQSVQALKSNYNVSSVLEVGPGKVLCGLGKRIDRALPHQPTESPETMQAALDALAANA